MTDYCSNATWNTLAEAIRGAERIALVTHRRPDGDALGSLLALARGLPELGKRAEAYVMGSIEEPLTVIAGATPYRRVEHDPPGDDFDLILVVDTGAWGQLEPLVDWLRRHHERVFGIDHHPQGDLVAVRRIVDTTAASTTLMLVDLLDELGCSLTPGRGGVAEALFVGLATDTGWFRFTNADARAFRVASRLLEQDLDKPWLFDTIEQGFPPSRLAVETRALESIEYLARGAVAIQTIRRRDLEETGATIDQLTGVVNRPMIVGSVRISILLVESGDAETKVSLRGKPGTGQAVDTDVNRLAGRLGGGGHLFAAGARMTVGIEEARRRVHDLVESEGARARS